MPKKTRAIKVTDVRGEKPWLKKVGINPYPIETIEKRKRFLIVCEGQTESLYFKSFPVLTAEVFAIPQGASKTSLIECTSKYMENEDYDEVWCVFDMDYTPGVNGQFEDFNKAIDLAHQAGFHCAYSNDSFELWFVLHYEYSSNEQLRSFYFEKLSKYWGISYEKTGKTWKFARSIYALISEDPTASQGNAIQYARKLYEIHRDKTFHLQNPVTTVYALVTTLNEHLRR